MREKNASVSKTKKKAVEELVDLIKRNRTILIASIKDIPASQFQEIGKKLRDKAIIKVPKKSLIFRALDSFDKGELKKLKEQIKDNVAILFSNLDSFELASELIESKRPAKAKIGQESPEDIEIPAGPTDLIPGPAVSELGILGIKIQIEGGKISIKEPKVIVKKNEKVSANAADVMNKLNIKPFSIGLVPISSFDTKEGKLYLDIKIDKEGTLKELKTSFSKALSFAVEICYTCKDTILFLISKAGRHEKILENLINKKSPVRASQNTQSIKTDSEEK